MQAERRTKNPWHPEVGNSAFAQLPALPAAVVVFLGYAGLAFVSSLLSGATESPGHVVNLWLANGFALAALLYTPASRWPLHLAAISLASVVVPTVLGFSLGRAASTALPNVAAATLSASLVAHIVPFQRFKSSISACLATMALGIAVPSLLAAAVAGASVYAWSQQAWGISRGAFMLEWFGSDLIGGLVALPLSLALISASSRALAWRPRAWLSHAAGAMGAALATGVTFSITPNPYIFTTAVLLLVSGLLRYSTTTVALLVTALVSTLVHATGWPVHVPNVLVWDMVWFVPLGVTMLAPLLYATLAFQRQLTAKDVAYERQNNIENYEHTPALLHSIDAQGRILQVSDLWCEKLGYRREEVIGHPSVEFLSPESRDYALSVVLPAFKLQGRVDNVEYQMRTRDGRLLDVLLSAHATFDKDGRFERSLAVSEDVTDKRRLLRELSDEHELVKVTLDSIGDAVLTADNRGHVDYMNPVAERLTGWPLEEARGKRFDEVVTLRYASLEAMPVRHLLERLVALQSTVALPENVMLKSRSGMEVGVKGSLAPVFSADEESPGAVLVIQDDTAMRELASRMTHLAQHDMLTELPNRLLMRDRVLQLCQRGLRSSGQGFAVLFLDVDFFKRVNDTLGHGAGDQVLVEFVHRVRRTLRTSDTFARLNGDEFIVLVPDLVSGEMAGTVAAKILDALAPPLDIGSNQLSVSASIGISLFPSDGKNPDDLLRHADAAMHRAKREGRNCARFFSRALDEAIVERTRLSTAVEQGLARGEMQLYFQPLVDIDSGRVVAVEALTRWFRDGVTPLSPVTFLHAVEGTDFMNRLGAFTLDVACTQMQEWVRMGCAPDRVCVNVSPVQFSDAGFVASVKDALDRSGLYPGYLELEITETVLMQEPAAATRTMQGLKELGVHMAVDDFGTGYSSLSYLKRFPVDTLKIDKSFVNDIETNQDDAMIVAAIIGLARSLGLRVVAEGVETAEQAQLVKDLGCTVMQGYLFARPDHPRPLTDWLQHVRSSAMTQDADI